MAKYFSILEWDNKLATPINDKGQPSRYEDLKRFKTRKDAQRWIDRHTYAGMSFKYEIVEVEDNAGKRRYLFG